MGAVHVAAKRSSVLLAGHLTVAGVPCSGVRQVTSQLAPGSSLPPASQAEASSSQSLAGIAGSRQGLSFRQPENTAVSWQPVSSWTKQLRWARPA